MKTYHKTRSHAPKGFFKAEYEGLLWLKEAEVARGCKVALPVDFDDDFLDTEFILTARGQNFAKTAFDFGEQLAFTHNFECDFSWGFAPSQPSYYGPLIDPVQQAESEADSWFDYFSDVRLRPMLAKAFARRQVDKSDVELTEKVISAVEQAVHLAETADALFPPEFLGDHPARIHGDLWSGNTIWGEDGIVLIDPAALAGCREEDLAMLNLFGCSNYSDILRGYNEVHPIPNGFEFRKTLHNLHPILGHVTWFGGSYLSQYRSMCLSVLGVLTECMV